MVEVMKKMATSFKRSSACHTAPDPAAGHHHPFLCQGLLNSQASLVQSLMGSFIVPSKSLFPQSCVSSGSSMVGLMMTSSKRAYAIPRSVAPRAPPPGQATADPYLCRRHSNTQRQGWLSLCRVSGCAQGFV